MKKVTKFALVCLAITIILLCFVVPNKKEIVRIGVSTSSVFGEIVKENYPDAQILYFDLESDLPVALESNKIDAYVADEITSAALCEEYPNQYISKRQPMGNYGFIMNLDNEKLQKELDEYITFLEETGALQQKKEIWTGIDENKKTIDFDSIKDNKPVIVLATTGCLYPFVYLKDGQYVGYEIDIIVSFCEKHGYGLTIQDLSLTGILASISSGKADIGSGAISITEERKEKMLFTKSIYEGSLVYVEKRGKGIESFSDLDNKEIGIQSGAAYEEFIRNNVDNPHIQFFNMVSDLVAALDSNKISGFAIDKPVGDCVVNQSNGKYKILGSISKLEYGIAIPRSRPNNELLSAQLTEYIQKIKANGQLQEKYEIWTGSDESKKVVDKSNLTAEKGTLIFATSSAVGEPFSYVKNDDLIGYDVDIIYSFAREYGYDITLQDYSFDGVLAAIASGKCDLSACSIAITKERTETINFPETYLVSDCVIVVKNNENNKEKMGFIESIIDSFDRTFIKEKRYLLFLDGMIETISIAFLSILFGTVLGLLAYVAYINLSKPFQSVIDGIGNLLLKMPVVVILMILYYVVFGDTTIKSSVISIIGLSILFANSVKGLIEMGVNSIDKGQMEAAYALGYSKDKAFIKIILPQAILNVISAYKSSIVTMVKDSAIVGYIAVQDLTKVSDIIRSRTYQAFFPLISTAIIYYLIATAFSLIIENFEFVIDPKKRKVIPALKGVKKNDSN